jgi:hypothetical protein
MLLNTLILCKENGTVLTLNEGWLGIQQHHQEAETFIQASREKAVSACLLKNCYEMLVQSFCSWQGHDASGDLSPKFACSMSSQLSKNQVTIIDLTIYSKYFSQTQEDYGVCL